MSEGSDLSAPDRVDDWVYNRYPVADVEGRRTATGRAQLGAIACARGDRAVKEPQKAEHN